MDGARERGEQRSEGEEQGGRAIGGSGTSREVP